MWILIDVVGKMTPHGPCTMECEATITHSCLSHHAFLTYRHNHLKKRRTSLFQNKNCLQKIHANVRILTECRHINPSQALFCGMRCYHNPFWFESDAYVFKKESFQENLEGHLLWHVMLPAPNLI